ncbi:MAG: cysteine hydrolase [Myxococcota bacterium]|nr:cysteine hydrolase [Myxococcota bacterium]
MGIHYDARKTAVVLIGYQNDYFADDGILTGALEDAPGRRAMLKNTVEMLDALVASPMLIVSTPIVFTPDYRELSEPTGILEVIKDVGAFKEGERGAETIPEIARYGDRIQEVPGKRGLNAFSNTKLDALFREHAINDVVLAGVVTSICIDSTGRAAHERGYRVSVLQGCTAGRTTFEQEFYCEKIFPLYAHLIDSGDLIASA